MVDILPDSPAVVSVVSVLVSLACMGMLSESKDAHRGSWIAFCLARALLPVTLCLRRADLLPMACYVVVTALSLIGPLASWPARSFALADASYALTHAFRCGGCEAAVVAALLCLVHDLVARHLLFFLESAAFPVAAVFVAESVFVVASGAQGASPLHDWRFVLDPWGAPDLVSYLCTRAPPVLILAWASGLHLRTWTQGRLSARQLARTSAAAAAVGVGLLAASRTPRELASKPVFGAVVAIVAAALSTFAARQSRRRIPLNDWVPATGLFAASAAYVADDDDADVFDAPSSPPAGNGVAALAAGLPAELAPVVSEWARMQPDRAAIEAELDSLDVRIKQYKQQAFRKESLANGLVDKQRRDEALLEVERWNEQVLRACEERRALQSELAALA